VRGARWRSEVERTRVGCWEMSRLSWRLDRNEDG
jgi:hypothetical protein